MRRFGSGDAEQVIALLKTSIKTTWAPQMTEAVWASFTASTNIEDYVEKRGSAFLLAQMDGLIVGMADRNDNFINALHVHAAHKRCGIGSALMDKMETEIEAAGHDSIRLETDTFNSASRDFYSQRGYIEIDRYPDQEWNCGLTTLLLEKSL